MEPVEDWSVYIARCGDGSLYTGVAKNVNARLAVHNAGRGAAYTRPRRPLKLVYREDGMTRSAALSREAGIKSLDRLSKLALVKAARRLLAVAALLLLGAAAKATPTFDKEGPAVFSSATPQAFTGSYPNLRMYFIRASSGIEVGSALSANGVSWVEDGPLGRLSTATLPFISSASAITGCGVLPLAAGGFRMEYSIVSTTNAYRIHSATSADGLAWATESGVRIDNGATYLGSPKIVKLQDASWRMYYIGGTGGGVGGLRMFSSRSVDEGLTWSAPSLMVSTLAYTVGASVLTSGKVRLYYSQPLSGSSTATVILSAISTDANGSSFGLENAILISTPVASGAVSAPVPVVATDTFRWRLYYDFHDPGVVSTASIHTALTGAPAPSALAPSRVLNTQSTVTFTISGDIFSFPAPTAYLAQSGQANITATGLTRVDDQTLTLTFNVLNQHLNYWDLVVTNADSRATTLSHALYIDFSGGNVALLNNLLRPRNGVPTLINITTYNDGRLLVRLYALDGRPVRTLFDGEQPKGTLNLSWDGLSASGGPVASGVYLLRVIGQKIDSKSKIVLIR